MPVFALMAAWSHFTATYWLEATRAPMKAACFTLALFPLTACGLNGGALISNKQAGGGVIVVHENGETTSIVVDR